MADANPKGKSKVGGRQIANDKAYAKLLIYPARKATLNALVIGLFLVFTSMIFKNMQIQGDWRIIAVPIGLLGLLFCLLPDTEEWEYKPWQSSAQQYERHFKD
jgi:hypothetical protein